jgi:hypothetical protein
LTTIHSILLFLQVGALVDETGIVRAEISDQDEVRMVVSSVHQDPRRPVSCRRLPAAT